MKKQPSSIDGFVPRRESRIDTASDATKKVRRADVASTGVKKLHTGEKSAQPLRRPQQQTTLGHANISQSLSALDDEEKKPLTRKERKAEKRRKKLEKIKHPRRRKIIKWSIIALIVIVLALAGYLIFKVLSASNGVFNGNILGVLQEQKLKEDENGRSNFIIYGTAEDDEGGAHGGANLTDSLMVLSINQTTKDAYMVSLPRDLWVSYDEACDVGYEGKINAVYYCASGDGQNEEAGAVALQSKVGEILGLDIQYYAHLNFTAVTELVDAVGGVTVTIESNPEGVGILDRNFDWKCNYQCYYVNYEDGETVELDGEHALALARARNASGGYGLSGGNFDREKNQQKIIKALREKAVSAGTLTNIGKVTGILDAIGNNLRTNVETSEIRTLAGLATDIQSDNIRSLTLVDEENPLVTTGNVAGASIVQPVDGLYDYGGIQSYIRKNSSSDPVIREAAPIVVLNGTDTAGLAQTEADKLEDKGYTISVIDNAPAGNYSDIEVYKVADGYTQTGDALKKYYGIESFTEGTPPVAVASGVGYVVVFGAERTTTQNQ